jgi:PAS domain S-box-containing protein
MNDDVAGLHLVIAGEEATDPVGLDALERAGRGRPLRSPHERHEHLVQFYDDEGVLYDAVARFAAAGLASGEPVILIATEAHRRALVNRLRLSGCRLDSASVTGQLTLLDARNTLSTFLVGDEPDWEKFSSIVGGLIEKSREGRREAQVRLYGEMVDLLWRDGNKQAAIRLEELWNDLAKLHPFSLLCSYAMGGFYEAGGGDRLAEVCGTHTAVISTEGASLLGGPPRSLEREIEHRKQLEAARRNAVEERLALADGARRVVEERNEERLRLLVESVHDYAIFMLDPKGCVTSWNVGAQRIKGYRAEEIIGQHLSRFYPEEDVRAGKCEHELEVAASVGRFEDEGWRVRKDGSQFWANVIISRMVERDGTLIGFAKVTRDLTQRRALEEERVRRATLEQALLEQQRTEELRELLLGVVGHDLRSPLASITMGTAMMLKRGKLEDSDSKTAARIARSADRMSKIISQLLDFTRVRLGGGIPIDRKAVDLAELCAEVIAEQETVHPDRALRLDADVDTHGMWDRERLAQVVSNLIGNAIRHGKPNGPIDVRLRGQSDVVCLQIHNEGPPIPADVLPSIFDPFRRHGVPAGQRSEGLGLGLFIVREMVKAHSGEIGVQSTEAAGTTFSVTLPRR